MNEFDLQMYERELEAWHRRLERQPPGALTSTLHEIAEQVYALRSKPPENEWHLRADVLRQFASLRTLYEASTRL